MTIIGRAMLTMARRASADLENPFRALGAIMGGGVRSFSGLYQGRFHLPPPKLEEAFQKSKLLQALQSNLAFQPDNLCVSTVGIMLDKQAKQAAAVGDDGSNWQSKTDNFALPLLGMPQSMGPAGPTDEQTRSERLANMVKELLQAKGPVVLHHAGIGGSGEYTANLSGDGRVPDQQVPYDIHAVLVVDVTEDGYAIIVDPNDRSTHELITNFKEKHSDQKLENLDGEQIEEHGLHNAMIYIAPLEEMLEYSLMEYCAEKLREQKATILKTLNNTLVDMKEGYKAVSNGFMYTHPNPPDSFKKPDEGLRQFVRELRKEGRLITPEALQAEVEKKKSELRKKYEDFDALWEIVHGEKLTRSKGMGGEEERGGYIDSQTADQEFTPSGICDENFDVSIAVARKPVSGAAVAANVGIGPTITQNVFDSRGNANPNELLTGTEQMKLQAKFRGYVISPKAITVGEDVKVKSEFFGRRADGSILARLHSGNNIKSQLVPADLVPPEIRQMLEKNQLKFGDKIDFVTPTRNKGNKQEDVTSEQTKPRKGPSRR